MNRTVAILLSIGVVLAIALSAAALAVALTRDSSSNVGPVCTDASAYACPSSP